MKMDFSQLNLLYLIQARDLAQQNPQLASTALGIPDEIANIISELPPQALMQINRIKSPLLTPRQEEWWWFRLVIALRDGRLDEIDAVIEHASLTMTTSRK